MSRRVVAWLVAVVAILFAARGMVSGWRLGLSYETAWDLDIYVRAIERMDAGVSIYDWVNDFGMGFTYPPFAALLMAPLTWASQVVVTKIWLIASIIAAALIVLLLRIASGRMNRSAWGVAIAAGSVGAFLGTSTVQDNLISGQVNLFLGVLLVLDVGQFVPRRFRGVLVGLAAAIKLTPLIVVVWYVLTGQWRAASTALGVFIAAAALGFALLPSDAHDFWARAVRDTSRVGPLDLPGNASLTGTLAKAGVDGTVQTVLWLGVGGLIVLVAFWQAERSRRIGDPAAAAIILGCAAVVASPISWPAHQIWLPLAGLFLAWQGTRWRLLIGVAVVLFCFFHIPLSRLWDGRGVVEMLLDDLDFLFFTVVCVAGLSARRDGCTDAAPVHTRVKVPSA